MADEQTNLMAAMTAVESSGEAFTLDEFHMKPAQIASAKIVDTDKGYVNGKWVEHLEVPQKQLFMESNPLKTVKNKEGKEIVFTAKEWFNLILKKDGTVGWSTNEKAKLQKFMKAVKVAHPKDLVGKAVIVNVVDKKNDDGSKTQQLRFMY